MLKILLSATFSSALIETNPVGTITYGAVWARPDARRQPELRPPIGQATRQRVLLLEIWDDAWVSSWRQSET